MQTYDGNYDNAYSEMISGAIVASGEILSLTLSYKLKCFKLEILYFIMSVQIFSDVYKSE